MSSSSLNETPGINQSCYNFWFQWSIDLLQPYTDIQRILLTCAILDLFLQNIKL